MNVVHPDLLQQFVAWASTQPAILGVTVFGSRARDDQPGFGADQWSDVDLHVITTEPEQLAQREWAGIFTGRDIWAFAVRPASGGVAKVTVLLSPGQEVDVVVVPAGKFRVAAALMRWGLHRCLPGLHQGLNEMATVMRGGHCVLKGADRWAVFYQRVIADLPGTRMNDAEARELAEEFVCDYIWIRQKLQRGEFIAAQRVLHRSLAEINFRYVHELRLREGVRTYREARRVEVLLSPVERDWISVESKPERASLEAAVEHCAISFRLLVQKLLGGAWSWPRGIDSPAADSRLRAE